MAETTPGDVAVVAVPTLMFSTTGPDQVGANPSATQRMAVARSVAVP